MDNPLVSVLTPVHNGERFIAEAIRSVLSQTYKNWEYTIVENCSTDNTLEIARDFASDDNRINVVQTDELLALKDNLNYTMRQLTTGSKYCKVLHADDILLPECVELMVNLAEKHPSIGVVSSYRVEGNRVLNNGISYPDQFLTGREVCRRSLMEGYFYVFGSPSTLLLRSDLVSKHDPFYSPRFFMDVEACYTLLNESDFGFVHQVLSYSRLHEKSYTSTAEGLGMSYLGILNALVRFGNLYLDDEEFKACIKKRLYDYYRYLGVNLIQRRKRDFWQYQEKILESLGLHLNRSRVVVAAIGVIISNLTRPGQYEKLIKRWKSEEDSQKQFRL